MKFGIREFGLLAGGFVLGAVAAAALTATVSWLAHKSATQAAIQADQSAQRCFDTLLSATAANDYKQFVSVADDTFRRSITPKDFQSISQSLAPRMKAGFTPTYLGKLRQEGTEVSMWRLTFADGGDDRLVRMSLAQDRVNGCLITPVFW